LHPPQGGGVQGPGANSPPGHAVGPVVRHVCRPLGRRRER
jgi:hypothetical protein